MATIAVAHRLARITFAMLRDGTDFDVAQPGIEEAPFEGTTIQRYRLKRPVFIDRAVGGFGHRVRRRAVVGGCPTQGRCSRMHDIAT